MQIVRNDIRNVAIIAHVDHGKTTLVDQLLKQARVFRDNQPVIDRVMDSNDLERERGITILSKNTSISIPHHTTGEMVKINIVDTPGHADFGGEVERIMNMVDGVMLLVDAAEGPMPQTRFVLKKALEVGLPAIVVINKMDRKDAEPDNSLNATFDLFIELGANDTQAGFPIIYANAVTGQAGITPALDDNLGVLFNAIVDHIPAPHVDPDAALQILITNLSYDDYRGNIAIGRVHAGTISRNSPMARIGLDGKIYAESARYLYVYEGLKRVEVESAIAGEIVAIAGLENVGIGETLTDPENPVALPPIYVEAPTVKMTFGVNTSPFAGREGRYGTSRKLRERLMRELRSNIALRVEETQNANTFSVSGRGELHLAILMETMRREGYEFEISRPEVIYKRDDEDGLLEPYEEVHVDIPADAVGTVVELLGSRHGTMLNMQNQTDHSVHLTYLVPTRGLLGFRHTFLTTTRGSGTMNSLFHGYEPFSGPMAGRSTHSIIAWETGITTTFGLKNAEERGLLFVGPGVDVYEGMVVGETLREGDVTINVCKKKHLTNMRQSIRDIDVRLTPPRELSLDEAVEYLADDELLEITPTNYRIRKKILNAGERNKVQKRMKEELQT